MKERPILFSAPMVRALLAGRKTQTRRHLYVVRKATPSACFDRRYPPPLLDMDRPQHGPGECFTLSDWRKVQPGDRLWVRETWMQLYEADNDGGLTCLPPTGESSRLALRRAKYRADGEKPAGFAAKWTPAIHMPRWASRITLEVTGVRVERLQDISRGDAMDEGCPFPNMAQGPDPRQWYADLWASINGPGSWDANPWVWVIGFGRQPECTSGAARAQREVADAGARNA